MDKRKQPFCWQMKYIVRYIQKHYKQKKSALAVYLVLTQVCSDNQVKPGESIEAYGLKIMDMSGVGRDSYREILNKFSEDGIIDITLGDKKNIPNTNKYVYGKSTITLLSPEFNENS